MIRQNFCPKCQQITSQKITKSLSCILTTCQQCHKAIDLVFRTRKPPQSVKARKPMKQVSTKQAKRNRELAKIEPPPDGRCTACKNLPDFRGLQKHHKTFRSHGGKDTPDNIEFLCGKCHSLRHNIHEK